MYNMYWFLGSTILCEHKWVSKLWLDNIRLARKREHLSGVLSGRRELGLQVAGAGKGRKLLAESNQFCR